jgi:four helix bundle protein
LSVSVERWWGTLKGGMLSHRAIRVPRNGGHLWDMETGRRENSARWFAVEKLDVFWAAVSLLSLCDRASARLWRRNASLYRQLQRAVASILANIGEGAACSGAADRRRYFEYAYRSAGECSALIIAFDSLGALSPGEYGEARELLQRIQMMLQRMMQQAVRRANATPNSR